MLTTNNPVRVFRAGFCCDINESFLLFLHYKRYLGIVAVIHVSAYLRLAGFFAGDNIAVNVSDLAVGGFHSHLALIIGSQRREVKLVADFRVEREGDRGGVVGLEAVVEVFKAAFDIIGCI